MERKARVVTAVRRKGKLLQKGSLLWDFLSIPGWRFSLSDPLYSACTDGCGMENKKHD